MRKIGPDRQAEIDRLHARDCPAAGNFELQPCVRCIDSKLRSKLREEMLERVRADRLKRQGQPRTSEEHVRRDMTASMALAGVVVRFESAPGDESGT
jgi:hypothetical protein